MVYFNVEERVLCDAAGVPLSAGKTRLFLTLFCKYVLKLTFLNADGTAAIEWQGQKAFWGAIDNNFDRSIPPYVEVGPDHWNVSGDWTEESLSDGTLDVPDPEVGKLSCRIDLSTPELEASLSTAASGSYTFVIHGRMPGETRSTCIMSIPITIANVESAPVDVWATATPTPSPSPTPTPAP